MSKDIVGNRVNKYYNLEKKTGYLFIVIALIFMTITFLAKGLVSENFWSGMMYPLRILSIIQFIIGIGIVYNNSTKAKEWNQIPEENKENRQSFLTTERESIQKTDGGFEKLSNIFMLLILLGGVFVLLGFIANWGEFSIGTGLGLLVPSALIYLINQYRAFNVGTHLGFLNSHSK